MQDCQTSKYLKNFSWILFFWLFVENNLFLKFRLFDFLFFHNLL
ncbi:unnamed protein product, partial [Vitis vinifera]